MSHHNAELSLPPGDRDDALSSQTKTAPPGRQEHVAVAGREPSTGGGNGEQDLPPQLKQIRATVDEAQLALGEIALAYGRADWPALEAASWRLNEALMVNLHLLAADARRTITRGRREAIAQETRL